MSRESTEELRRRLLRDERVRELISRRAYEIYVMRGGRPGGEGHDWFQAESEILSILIEEESRRADESTGRNDNNVAVQPVDETSIASPVAESLGVPETSDRMDQSPGLTAQERAESQSAIGTWSATEPMSTERAPIIGDVGEFQTGASAPKKTRARDAAKAPAKSATTRKSKPSNGKSTAAKEPAVKEPAANEPTARKAAARTAASNKPAEPTTKTSRSRKKSKE
jgi:Protein of unknown function (DUF2934)